MADPNRPITESYWVIANHLLAGEYPGKSEEQLTRRRIDAFIESGFDTFIDLTQPNETLPYVKILLDEAKVYEVKVTHQRFPIGDFGLPTPEQMNSILDAIDQGLQSGHKIYLHCWGGIGRTGTTVGCYLVRYGKTSADALNQLSVWWRGVPKSLYYPYSPETAEQMDFIHQWANHDDKVQKTSN